MNKCFYLNWSVLLSQFEIDYFRGIIILRELNVRCYNSRPYYLITQNGWNTFLFILITMRVRLKIYD